MSEGGDRARISGATRRRVRAGAIDLGYDEAGDGTPLVLLHAFPLHRGQWAPQRRGLAHQARIIAPDLRGFGQSSIAPPYSVEQYADDVAALLDALEIDRAIVGGTSIGGYVTFAFWRRHRSRALGLVLANTRAPADSPEARERRRHTIARVRAAGAEPLLETMLPSLVGPSTRARHPEIVDAVRTMIERAPRHGLLGALDALLTRPDSTPTLATIDVPTLVIAADEDPFAPAAEMEAMARAIPGARFELIRGAAHVSNLERPAAFNAVVLEWLNDR